MAIIRSQGRNHYNSSFESSVQEVPAAMSMMIDSMVNMIQSSRKSDQDTNQRFASDDN
jgi:hypothetical protein